MAHYPKITTSGGGGGSFLYTNTCFVHPDGNNTTAVIGNFDLPFQTIEGAFYGTNGLDMAGSPKENGVIEVWPDTKGKASDYPFTNFTTMPAFNYDYEINTPLVTVGVNWCLHLKSSVHIRYNQTNPSLDSTQCALFTIINGGGELKTIVTVTSEDPTSSIECFNNTPTNSFVSYQDVDTLLIFDNVSIYDEPLSVGSTQWGLGFALFSFWSRTGNCLRFKNCTVKTNNKRWVDVFGETAPIEFSQIMVGNWATSETSFGSVVEIVDSNFSMHDTGSTSSIITAHLTNYCFGDGSGNMFGEFRARNSNFINSRVFQLTSGNANRFVNNFDGSLNVYLDDCITYLGTPADNDLFPNRSGGFPFFSTSTTDSNVFYVSRSLHNYNTADPTNPYDGLWLEYSGPASSVPTLGFFGFGMYEFYKLVQPFDWTP